MFLTVADYNIESYWNVMFISVVCVFQISSNHHLLHAKVLDLLVRLFEASYEELDVLVRLELKKTILDRMVHLLSRGCVVPVVAYIKICWDKGDTDISLIRHFVTEVCIIQGLLLFWGRAVPFIMTDGETWKSFYPPFPRHQPCTKLNLSPNIPQPIQFGGGWHPTINSFINNPTSLPHTPLIQFYLPFHMMFV